MAPVILIAGLLLLVALFGPQLWVQRVMRRYSQPLDHLPGTGGELARHLLDRFRLQHVTVEPTDTGDHYDPQARAVRLSPENLNNRSLTAVAVATHEVGHAIQHALGERSFHWRGRMVVLANWAQKASVMAMIAIPFITLLTRAPVGGALMFLLALLAMGTAALTHLITLPVEWDASFGKALPILQAGRYVDEQELGAVRSILRAAAFTYVAASLASLLNLGRWLVILRR